VFTDIIRHKPDLRSIEEGFFKYSSVISDGFPVMVGKNIMSFNAKIYNLLKK